MAKKQAVSAALRKLVSGPKGFSTAQTILQTGRFSGRNISGAERSFLKTIKKPKGK